MLQCLMAGGTVAGIIGLVMGITRIVFGVSVSFTTLMVVFAGGLVGGAIIGTALKQSWKEAAAAVDRHYGLKDRTTTALEFANQTTPSGFQQLQLNDAREHLQRINAAAVVPYRVSKQWRWCCLTLAIASVMVLQPQGNAPAQAELASAEGIAEAAAKIQEELDEMEQLAAEAELQELQQLVEQLQIDLEELHRPDIEVRESLETISDMQQKMQEMMASLDVEAIDAQLSETADAIAGAEAFKTAADALQNQDYQKAADALDSLQPEDMPRSEALPTSEKLAAAAKSAEEKDLQQLSEQLKELSEAIQNGDSQATESSSEDLAKAVRKHDLQKNLSQMLASKIDQLGESKKLCQAASDKPGEGGIQGEGTSLAKGESDKKATKSSNKAGSKTAGNIDGEKTRLQGELQMAKLNGQMTAEGESEFETETDSSPQSPEQAQRKAQQAFAKYQKMSEAVLESEPIPLGHRQTIRRYFELIRPSGEEAAEADNADN